VRMIKIVMVVVLLMCFATAVPAAKVAKKSNGRGDVVELSQKLRKVIRLVEKSEMACGPRNTLVRRLRLVDDALVSGQRTAASGLLTVWIKRAEKMAAAGTLEATLHVQLEEELQAILEQIGTGWSRKAGPTRNWPPLPSCDPWVTGRAGAYEVWDGKEDVMTLISTTIKEIHPPGRVGILVSGLIKIFWPGEQQPDISTLIDEAIDDLVRQQLMDDLAGLEGVLNNFNYYENAWYEKCGANPSGCTPLDAESVRSEYLNAVDFFTNARPHFQSNGPSGDYRVKLLDVYAQYETMYLSLLGEGVVWGADWGWTGGDLAKPGLDLAKELDPTNTASGIGYVNQIYEMGIPYPDKYDFDTDTQIPTSYQDKWTQNNAYIRDMTLNVLQFAAAWPYMDPVAWPNGNPDFKYDAMIYSDPVGYRGDDFKVSGPDNVSYPLSHVKVWVQDEFENATGYITAVIDSMQMTNSPFVGPQMGDTSHDWSYTTYGCDVAPGTVYGPIWAVSATDDEYSSDPGSHVQSLKFSFANGQNSPLLGSTYGPKHTYYFAYEDWVVANAKIMGTQKVHYDWKWAPLKSADCLIFGFRRDDSF
jgi:delta endotoxin, N-terminal domain